MHQSEKISLPCIYTALCPSEKHHPHPPHMIPKFSDTLKKRRKKQKERIKKTTKTPPLGKQYTTRTHVFVLTGAKPPPQFSFSQVFLSRRAGKINSRGAAGRGRAEPGPGSPFPAPSTARAGRCLLGTSAYCPASRLRGSAVG